MGIKTALKILLAPVAWPIWLNTQLAKGIKSRIGHWFLGMFVMSFGWPILLVLVFGYLALTGQITAETDFQTFEMPPGALATIWIGMGYFWLVSMFGPWLPGAAAIHRERNRPRTFGDARFSSLAELAKAGMIGAAGIVFGRKDGKLVEKPPQLEGHGLVVGGPGTGKSRGVAIPTLLRWPGAALVIDVKGELSEVTAKARSGAAVYIFDPFRGGHSYDPLRECQTVDGAQELARTLIPEPPKGEPFWAKSAQGIFAAAVLEAAHEGGTLCEVAERVCITPPEQLIAELQQSRVKGTRLLSSIGVGMPEKTLGGVMAELRSKLLTLASDEGIAAATSRSDFTPETLEAGATIYLRIAEHLLTQYKELWAVILNQMIRHLTKRPEKASPAVLVLLDELPRLGEIPALTDALATLRSRNVHILSIVQSMAQLDMLYGPDRRKVIADNCRYKLVLSASDPETQRYFADLTGQQTVHAKGMTIGAGWVPNMSRNETGVHLIRPEAWARLEKPVLLTMGMQPTQVEPAFWDLDKDLRRLA